MCVVWLSAFAKCHQVFLISSGIFAFFFSHLIDTLSPSIYVCSNRCDYLPSNSGASAATANCNTWTCQLWYRCGDGCQGHRDTAVLPMQDDLVLQRQQKAATRTSSVDSLANHQEQLVICSYLLTPWYNFFFTFSCTVKMLS